MKARHDTTKGSQIRLWMLRQQQRQRREKWGLHLAIVALISGYLTCFVPTVQAAEQPFSVYAERGEGGQTHLEVAVHGDVYGELNEHHVVSTHEQHVTFEQNQQSSEPEWIVDPYQMYTYERMLNDIDQLVAKYPELLHVETIGTTRMGRDLRAVRLGNGQATVLLDASQHAREWMGTQVLMYMLEQYAYGYMNSVTYDVYQVRELLDQCSIWFVPMVNPDGVTLQQSGLSAYPTSMHKQLLQMNNNSAKFERWKANAEGIDLNRQYPAAWEKIHNPGKQPWFKSWKGPRPAYALEVQSMMNFTQRIDPDIVLSYHSSGKVLFWYFSNAPEHMERDKRMADQLTMLTGYAQIKPEPNPSGGGFTDWFIDAFHRPGFTAELGPYVGETNLPLWTFTEIWSEQEKVGLYLAYEAIQLWKERNQHAYIGVEQAKQESTQQAGEGEPA